MENITLGQIAAILAFIVGIIGSIEFLMIRINKLFDKKLEPIKEELKEETICRLKTNIVNYLALAEQNLLIGKQRERAYEDYDKYVNKYNQNSYIHTEWERLQKEGKI